jgi:hypothetical protein
MEPPQVSLGGIGFANRLRASREPMAGWGDLGGPAGQDGSIEFVRLAACIGRTDGHDYRLKNLEAASATELFKRVFGGIVALVGSELVQPRGLLNVLL